MLSKQHPSFTATPQVFWGSWYFSGFVCRESILLAPTFLGQLLQLLKFISKEGTEQGMNWMNGNEWLVSLERNLLGQVRMEWQKPGAASLSSSPQNPPASSRELEGFLGLCLFSCGRREGKVWFLNIKRKMVQAWVGNLNSRCWEQCFKNLFKLWKFGFLLKCGVCSNGLEKEVVAFWKRFWLLILPAWENRGMWSV